MKKQKLVIKGNIPVQYFKEGDMFIAFAPAVDLSTCGKTFAEAKKNFGEALELFFHECLKRETLFPVLESYGWKRRKGKKVDEFVPPRRIGEEEFPLSAIPMAV